MKKILHTGVILAFLLALVPAGARAHTAPDPFVTDLLAGQDKDVGDVLVWNDADNLYVKYLVTEANWCLTETHLSVADSLEDIPQTKKGNPIPGQFEFSGYHECETEILYTNPLDGMDDDLFVAAHGVVKKYRSESGCIYSDTETKWYDPSADDWFNAVATWVHSSWPSVGAATWIWRTAQTVPADEYDDVPEGGWEFQRMYDLPGTAFNINATLYITADNSYSAAVNGSTVGSDGSMDKDGPDAHSWSSVESYDISSLLGPGGNTLTIHALNYSRTGTYMSNPAGLIFKVCGEYDYFRKSETAWADGLDFPWKNWATYFTYTVQAVLVGSVNVPSNGNQVQSPVALESGKTYRLDASGTYTYWASQLPDAGIADAKYSLRPEGSYNTGPGAQWISGDNLPPPWTNYLEVQVDGSAVDWGDFNTEHEYSVTLAGSGVTLDFTIIDNNYSDNSGSILVEIYELP